MKAITLRTSRTGWGAQIRGQQTDQNMCHLLSNSKLYHKKRKIKKASKLPKVLSHLKHRIRWFQEKINEHSRTRKYTNSKKKKKRKKFRPMSEKIQTNKFTEEKTEISEGTLIFGFSLFHEARKLSEVSGITGNNLRRFILRKLGEKTVIKKMTLIVKYWISVNSWVYCDNKKKRESICYNWMWPLQHHLIPKISNWKKRTKVFPLSRRNCISSKVDDFFFFLFSDTGSIEQLFLRKRETKEVRHIISPVCCQVAIFKRQGRILLQETEEDTNRKIFFHNGSEELILLKCPYYSKWSINQIWILLKLQWQFSQK